MDYAWPGNVRELENVIERAVVLSRSDTLSESDLPDHIAAAPPSTPTPLTFEIGTTLDEIELRVIRETLRHTKGDKSLAAQLLGHLDAHHLPKARRRHGVSSPTPHTL